MKSFLFFFPTLSAGLDFVNIHSTCWLKQSVLLAREDMLLFLALFTFPDFENVSNEKKTTKQNKPFHPFLPLPDPVLQTPVSFLFCRLQSLLAKLYHSVGNDYMFSIQYLSMTSQASG